MSEKEKYFCLIIAMIFYFVSGYVLRRRGMKMTEGVYCSLAIVAVLIYVVPLVITSNLPLNIKCYITVSAVLLTPIFGFMNKIFRETLIKIINPNFDKHKKLKKHKRVRPTDFK
jgi:hypothetical protein